MIVVFAHAGHLLVDLPVFLGPLLMLAAWLIVTTRRERRRARRRERDGR